jgi:intein-encoded DNA endonuclease-like protein
VSFKKGQNGGWLGKNHTTLTTQKMSKIMTAHSKKFPQWFMSKTYIKNHQVHPNLKPSADLAYVLGVLKGDGYVSVDGYGHYLIRLNVISLTFIKSFRSALLRINLNPQEIIIDNRESYHVTAQSKDFYQWYHNLKTSDVEQIIAGYETDFIRGFYEAEGNLSHADYGYKMRITNTNYSLIRIISKFLMYKYIKNSIHKYKNTTTDCIYYQLGVYRDVIPFLKLIKPSIKYLRRNTIIKDY